MGLGSYIDQIVYDALGHIGNVYYFRIVRKRDGYIYDAVTKTVVSLPTWEDSAIILVEIGTTGAFPIVIPAELTGDLYDIIVYKQLGSNPAETDDVEEQHVMQRGDIFGF